MKLCLVAFEDVGPEGLDAAGRGLFYDVDGSRDVDGVHCFCEPLYEKGGERLFGDDDSDYSGVGGDEAHSVDEEVVVVGVDDGCSLCWHVFRVDDADPVVHADRELVNSFSD